MKQYVWCVYVQEVYALGRVRGSVYDRLEERKEGTKQEVRRVEYFSRG